MASSRDTEFIGGYGPSEDAIACGYNGTNGTANSSTAGPNWDSKLVVLAIIIAFTIVGNGGVIFVLSPRWKNLRRLAHFMLNLAIADMLVAFWVTLKLLLENVLPNGLWTVGGDPLCKFLRFMDAFPWYTSSYMLVMCAVDRFIAICYPLKNYSWTNKRTYMLVTLAWGVSFVLALPHVFWFSSQYDESICHFKCSVVLRSTEAMAAYTLYNISITFFIPLIVLAMTYGGISYTVWVNLHSKMKTNDNEKENGVGSKKGVSRLISVISQDSTTGNGVSDSGSRQASDVRPRTHSMRDFSRAKLKPLAMTFVVVGAYIVCWTPLSVMMFWWALDKTILEDSTILKASDAIVVLPYLNSCCNPYIYLGFNYRIIKQFFCWRKRRPKQVQARRRLSSSTSVNSHAGFLCHRVESDL